VSLLFRRHASFAGSHQTVCLSRRDVQTGMFQSGQRQSRFEQMKNPSKSPLIKGRLFYSLFAKAGKGIFGQTPVGDQLSKVKLTLARPFGYND
jgi:hypothetical protein